jgi:hypothetical protein
VFGKGVEHVLEDHVTEVVVEPVSLGNLVDKCKVREFYGVTRDVAKPLHEFNLLGVHEERVRDLCRTEFMPLVAVHAGVCNVGKPDKMEPDVRRYNGDISKLKRCINEKTKNNDHGGKTKV